MTIHDVVRLPFAPRAGKRVAKAKLLILCLLLGTSSPAGAAEITSNGTGGGLWSATTTWFGGKIPGPDDDVVLRKYDVVTFDRNDADKVTCKKLQIDPKGVLQFKTNAGKLLCVVEAGGIENFGIIKMDGTRSASDDFELRLAGKAAILGPHFKLAKGSALLLYGRALKDGKKNVAIESTLYDDKNFRSPQSSTPMAKLRATFRKCASRTSSSTLRGSTTPAPSRTSGCRCSIAVLRG